ncbi:alpha-glucosidase [Paracoccus thiocyanatus]|uniref:Alpha-glucosidase n=1 Tax=Paracoccus thiocyanatus TaxID=34006 RepID=A0A1N6YYX0_9RHOB|nr:alpha-amylase family glycosyl hydrolase [Paracoccus thiocyanatus]SIR19808.1 alpha-glucosidase [Paracoccus thiocyanatus]
MTEADPRTLPGPSWWRTGVIYQVYPRSFQDSDGDGVGDLAGIRARLDHLLWLGVDAIWISPFYPSPMADFGYDVSDYCDVDPIFGTLADFDALVADAHGKGLRIILDFVPNHTSDQHPWFQQSRRAPSDPRRDWYIWRDPGPDGGPPNNWISNFGGSAWTWDETAGQYYYHAFLAQQPDLNWRNPQVRQAMLDAMRFWLDRGVDGFRVDVMWHLIKDDLFRDDPPNPAWREGDADIRRILQLHSTDRPEVHEVVRAMRRTVDAYGDRLLIGEIYLPLERLMAYYGEDLQGAHLPFNFQLIKSAWNAPTIAGLIREYEAALPEGGWPNWVLGNHDQKRIASRVGSAQARVAAMLLLTLRGTPTLYYGDEIGMQDSEIPTDRLRDPWALNEPGLGVGRDPQRTPMQWCDAGGAGFTSGDPWLPVPQDLAGRTVAAQRDDPGSLLRLYRDLLALRRSMPALTQGSLRLLEAKGELLAYERLAQGQRLLVALNLGPDPVQLVLPAASPAVRPRFSTDPARPLAGPAAERDQVRLAGNEGLILECLDA